MNFGNGNSNTIAVTHIVMAITVDVIQIVSRFEFMLSLTYLPVSAAAKSKVSSLHRQVKVLEANLAKTLMICESLWEILKQELKLTDEDLEKVLHEVDMRDGALDGKNQRKAIECLNCGHMVSARHPACLYCGQVIDTSVFSI